MPKYLDETGLILYHEKVVEALKEKASKVHVGVSEPEYTRFETWFDITEGETQAVSLMSLDNEELTFNDDPDEELTFNEEEPIPEESEEELTFNEDPDEELTFNE